MARFQQVVAEDGVLREAAGDGSLEGVHIVNPFADKRAFPEHILIDVRHFARVRINPASPANSRTNQERRALGRLTPTRGCKMP